MDEMAESGTEGEASLHVGVGAGLVVNRLIVKVCVCVSNRKWSCLTVLDLLSCSRSALTGDALFTLLHFLNF